jgi:hypothetical protein
MFKVGDLVRVRKQPLHHPIKVGDTGLVKEMSGGGGTVWVVLFSGYRPKTYHPTHDGAWGFPKEWVERVEIET